MQSDCDSHTLNPSRTTCRNLGGSSIRGGRSTDPLMTTAGLHLFHLSVMIETSEKESVVSTSTTVQNVQTIDVTSSQSAEAQEVTRHFNEIPASELRIRIESSSGDTVTVPESLSDLLQAVLRLAATGEAVGITRLSRALTSVEAAKFLGMSRPTLMKLAMSGDIPSHKVGSHTRFNRTDLQTFAERRVQSQRESFDNLRSFEDAEDFAE